MDPQPGLPNQVEEVRRAIAEAAVGCEYRRLEALARAQGEQFSFTFGDADGPARFWRRQEKAGAEPMRSLVGMLDRPYGKVSAGDLVVYVWPSAATYDSWADVPREARQALRPLYEDVDFEQFAEFGSYMAIASASARGVIGSTSWRATEAPSRASHRCHGRRPLARIGRTSHPVRSQEEQ